MLLFNAELAASTITDVGEAENWASMVQRQFRPWGFDLAPDLTVPEALEAARERGGVAAAVLAATLAEVGPRRGRHEARRLWQGLVAGGVVVPGWVDLLGAVTPVRAVCLTDSWGDECLLWIDYCRPDGSVCGLAVAIDRIWGGTAQAFGHGAPIEMVADKAAKDPDVHVADIDLADARAMIAEGLRERDATVRLDDEVEGDDDPHERDEELRALVDQRIGLLPLGGDAALPHRLDEEEAAAIVGAFLEWPHGQDQDIAEHIAETVLSFASYCCDGDPLRWSPPRIAGFLAGWIPAKVIADGEWLDAVEAVFPRWLAYSAERRGLAPELAEENLAVARDSFGAMRANVADADNWTPTTRMIREMMADGIDPSDPADRLALQAWIDQYNARPRDERH
ncbi:MAG: hypothetical protein OXE75_11350 [bacterium]|nr:hypothetical protein [bacterium]